MDPQWSHLEIRQLTGFLRYAMRYGLFLGMGLLLGLAAKNSQTFPDEMQTYFRQSVWQVQHELSNGSAFFVTRHLLVTNKHVVTNPYIDIPGEITIHNHNRTLSFPVKVLRLSEEYDLALLYCDCGGYQAMTLPFGSYPKQGGEMYGAGYGLATHLSFGFGHSQGSAGYYKKSHYFSSVPTIMGDSGSPILSKHMRVVGVRTAVQMSTAETAIGSISIAESFHAVIIGPRAIVDFLMGRDQEVPH
jgi:S1-C subfamily serine protease